MAIPPLDKRGLLPPGIYDCTLEDIAIAFSAPDSNHKRAFLFERLKAFVEWTRSIKWVKLVYVDGSFVTDKDQPSDVDVTIELPPATPEVARVLRQAAVFNRAQMKASFSVDVLPTTPELDFKDYFQTLKIQEARQRGLKPTARKGILRLAL